MATEKKTTIILKCDNPRCETALTWIDQEPENVPDGFFRFTFEQRFVEKEGFKEFAFCSRRCSHEYDRSFVPPLSPREQARQMQANTAADKRVIVPAARCPKCDIVLASDPLHDVEHGADPKQIPIPFTNEPVDGEGRPYSDTSGQASTAAPLTDTEIKVPGGVN